MKLFRKKEKLYGDLVKYSHKTALENADMIKREYDHQIEELTCEVVELRKDKKLYSFEVSYTDNRGYFPPNKELKLVFSEPYDLIPWPRTYYQGCIKFDKKKILEFVDVEPEALLQAVNHNKQIDIRLAKIQVDITTLKEERDKFVKNYIPKRKRK